MFLFIVLSFNNKIILCTANILFVGEFSGNSNESFLSPIIMWNVCFFSEFLIHSYIPTNGDSFLSS